MFWFLPVIFGGIVAGLGGAAVGAIIAAIADWLTEDTISETIRSRDEFKDALKAEINSLTTKTVKVGIFGYTEKIGEMEIESSKGVSDSLYVGQVIEL